MKIPGSFARGAALAIVLVLFGSPHTSRAGVAVGWGAGSINSGSYPNYGQSIVPAGATNPIAIAAGSFHSLALRSNGTVIAWGNNLFSQTNVPLGLSNVIAIAAGGDFSNISGHNLALRSDGTVVAWGDNFSGVTNVPAGLSNVVAIATGGEDVLALKNNGTVIAWGDNQYGQTNVPAFVTNAVAVAASRGHSLALTAGGTVIGWGYNYYGEATGVSTYPITTTNGWVTLDGKLLSNVVAVAAGESHNLALKNDGTVVAWGDNTYGQTNVPAGLTNVVAIGAGGSESVSHCLALKSDGTVVAWGWNQYGQTNVPGNLSNAVAVATGSGHSLALVEGGPPIFHVPLTNSRWASNRFSLSLPTVSGRVYALEYERSLTGDPWMALPLAAGTGGTLTLTDLTATNSQRFYRVRQW